jgi:hypothetical protein
MEPGEICPRCRKRCLARVIVHIKGSLDVCLCGYERIVEKQDPSDFEREYWKWKEGLSERALTFRAVEALLQSIYEVRVCAECAERVSVEELRKQAMELEHQRSYLAMDRHTSSDKKMAAYLTLVVDLLQEGVGQLCDICWEGVLQVTMRRFFGRYDEGDAL